VRIGILAYGSLIQDPGAELAALITRMVTPVETPFRVEFARRSIKRDLAPTLVPVTSGGSVVQASVLCLREGTSEAATIDALYRREINQVGSSARYDETKSNLRVREHRHLAGLDVCYSIAPQQTILEPDPPQLALWALESAMDDAGRERRDGITYLAQVTKNGILTPLTKPYTDEVLALTGALTLEAAWQVARMRAL
jgi:hypothetical protein